MNISLLEIDKYEDICVFGTELNTSLINLIQEKLNVRTSYKKKIRFYFSERGPIAALNELICISDLRSLNTNTLVILTTSDYNRAKKQFQVLKNKNINAIHSDFLTKPLSIKLLKLFEIWEFTDLCNNKVLLDKYTGDLVSIFYHNESISNCSIDVRGATSTHGLTITMYGNQAVVKTGRSSFNKVIISVSADSKVLIGDDCMFSSVCLHQSDMHHIFDLETRKRINKGKDIIIGNHVWLGRQTMCMGGTIIPDGCILGSYATTASKFTEKNCVMVGNPAKVVRRNVLWARDEISFDYEDFSQCNDQSGLKYL